MALLGIGKDDSRSSSGIHKAKRKKGYLAHTDFEMGRLINHLKEIHQLDNTVVFVKIRDNGASKEGTQNGVIEGKPADKKLKEPENLSKNIAKSDEIGTADAINGNIPWVGPMLPIPFQVLEGRCQ